METKKQFLNQENSIWEKEVIFTSPDVIIVGAGIVGLTTAINLKRLNPKLKVEIIERGITSAGASTKNAGFTCFGSPTEILDDLNCCSEDEVIQTIKKRYLGINELLQLTEGHDISYQNCGSREVFVDEAIFETANDKLAYLNGIFEEATACKNVFRTHSDPILKGFKRHINIGIEGKINTGKLYQSLVNIAQSCGVVIKYNCSLNSYVKDNKWSLDTSWGKMECNKLVFTTNAFSRDFLKDIDLKPARAQVIISKPNSVKLDTTFHFDKGYYYFRSVGDRVLLGGARNIDVVGETTDVLTNTGAITTHLVEFMKTNIDSSLELDYAWSGVMGVGESKSPIVKELAPSLFCGIRLGGMGVAIGANVGKELAKLIINGSVI
jgi:gamma-glutamylputrescine oxidase